MSATETKEELLRLDMARFDAMVARDIDRLADMLHDSLNWTHASASTDNKQGFLDRLSGPSVRYLEVSRSEEAVRIFGDAAIITAVASMRVIIHGAERELQNRYSNVWVREAGQWRMVHWQSTTVPAA